MVLTNLIPKCSVIVHADWRISLRQEEPGTALGGWAPPPNLEVGAPNIQYIAFNAWYLCKQKHRSIITNAYESIFYSINTTYKADRLKHLLCLKLGI